MDITTLFMTMCLNTRLPCAEIGVEFSETPFGIVGTAQLYNTGKMGITLSAEIKDSTYRVEETLLHEIAHLMVYTKNLNAGDHINNGHNNSFITACKKVSKAYGTNPMHCQRGDY